LKIDLSHLNNSFWQIMPDMCARLHEVNNPVLSRIARVVSNRLSITSIQYPINVNLLSLSHKVLWHWNDRQRSMTCQ